MRQPSVRVLVLSWLLLLTACVGPLRQWGEETTFHPEAASFNPSTLKQEQVAVLSAWWDSDWKGMLTKCHALWRVLDSDASPPQTLDGPRYAEPHQPGRTDGEYAGMVSDYVRAGIPDRVGLEKIGRALHVAYVFQPSLASFSQSMSTRLSILGLRLLQTRVTALRLTLQLWDTRTGEIVWESSGEATLAGEDVRESRIPFDEIARRLWSHMLDDLFTGLPVE
jgi:hypothetical protein